MSRSPWPIVLLLAALAAYLSPNWHWPGVDGGTVGQVPSQEAGTSPLTTDPSASLSPASRELFNRVRPASVQIEQLSRGGNGGLGSGFFITPQGLLLTAYHVVDGARIIRVRTVSDQTFPAKVVGFDNAADVALLQIQTRGTVPFLELAPGTPRVGERVLAVGNSRGDFLQARRGLLLALNAEAGRSDFPEGTLEMSAPLAPGDSGGPIVNTLGQAIGVVSYVRVDDQGNTLSSYAVPVTANEALITQLKAGVKRDVPAIGLTFDTDHDGLTNPPGGVISAVVSGGPAERAGLVGIQQAPNGQMRALGDVILSVNGQRTRSADDAIYEIRRHQIGDTVTLDVIRQGIRRTVEMRLVARGSLTFAP
ncbi:S1C family serine protease [Deinococcus sp. KNUC1210]|uniref:S1C family serine protease n=1 Tax=Deinococcus sp. KNUC1210 TaxID=2917691 RepID=UPI001EF09B18|nr:trypsin-like peptidase domain-containing protein [Deinococcus sp. KNUC1210]ULH14548.1 S1C family serine protease [Deinococcus sp. KNUC1210]